MKIQNSDLFLELTKRDSKKLIPRMYRYWLEFHSARLIFFSSTSRKHSFLYRSSRNPWCASVYFVLNFPLHLVCQFRCLPNTMDSKINEHRIYTLFCTLPTQFLLCFLRVFCSSCGFNNAVISQIIKLIKTSSYLYKTCFFHGAFFL